VVKNQDIFVVFTDIGHVVANFGDLPPIAPVDLFKPLYAFILISAKVLCSPHRFGHEALLVCEKFVFQGLDWHI